MSAGADEPPAAPSLRERGNSAFKNRDFETAEALYSAAIDETSSDADGDAASLLSNRAAARVELGKLDDAIADADSAIARAPTWTKAFYRKSQALRAKGDAAAACAALEQAVQLEPSSKFLAKQLQLAQASLRQRHREQPIESLEDWLSRWALVEAVLERLATFAFFWVSGILCTRPVQTNDAVPLAPLQNALSADERSKAFLKFLVLQSSTGVPPPNASEFTAQVFQEKLPTENYELSGIRPVAVWME